MRAGNLFLLEQHRVESKLYYTLRGVELPRMPTASGYRSDAFYANLSSNQKSARESRTRAEAKEVSGSMASSTMELVHDENQDHYRDQEVIPLKQIQKCVVIRQQVSRAEDVNDIGVPNEQGMVMRKWEPEEGSTRVRSPASSGVGQPARIGVQTAPPGGSGQCRGKRRKPRTVRGGAEYISHQSGYILLIGFLSATSMH